MLTYRKNLKIFCCSGLPVDRHYTLTLTVKKIKTKKNKMSTVPDSPNCKLQNINSATIPSKQNKKRKRKNKNKYNNKQLAAKKKVFKHKSVNSSVSKVVFTMSSWAERFTFAATWQLKHQLAYWKAQAKSLEYENGVLHDIIRKSQHVSPGESSSSLHRRAGSNEERKYEDATGTNVAEMPSPVKEGKLGKWEDTDGSNSQTMLVDMHSDSEDDISDEKQNIEVSEEFIQFLMINAKHKEELRLERQKQKAEEEQAVIEEREAKLRARRHYGLSAQELYGDKWQKIAALEMSMKSNFMSNIDSNKASYWPVIPFNFDLHYSYANQTF